MRVAVCRYKGVTPVLLLDQDMHAVALTAAASGFVTSELNPADSHGVVGEYWQNYGPGVEEKLALTHEHMALVKQLSTTREELADADRRLKRTAGERDHAMSELQRCAAELQTAQEHTQQAMAIAERHAAERDAALASVSDHRATLNELNERAHSERHASQKEIAHAKEGERAAYQRAESSEAQLKASDPGWRERCAPA